MHFRPYLLLAELTYRCPLHCPYCSNSPVLRAGSELSTQDWQKVLREAAALGALHAGFSGGEPLQRPDLEQLVATAREAGLYSNLITSALGLTRKRAEQLKAAGLDTVQISFQSDEAGLADQIAGARAHASKIEAAGLVAELGFSLTVNVVLHRANISRLERIIRLAEELGADRLELANTQFYGWAYRNRAALLPTREQIEEAVRVTTAARQRLSGKLDILFVVPDYYSDRPKPCMNGWGRRYLTVNPIGDVLPCPTAGEIPNLSFDNVRERSLEWIWHRSEAFNRFRGTEWMPEPCRSCDLREVDFGGCRCQAALITGDAGATDPACSLAPARSKLEEFVRGVNQDSELGSSSDLGQVSFRQNPTAVGSDAVVEKAYPSTLFCGPARAHGMPNLRSLLNRRLTPSQIAAVVALVAMVGLLGYGAYLGISAALLQARIRAQMPAICDEVRHQRVAIVKAIEAYKARFGAYPPDHILSRSPIRVDPITNTLLYELTGVLIDTRNHTFQVAGLEPAEERYVTNFFQCALFRNASSAPQFPTRFLPKEDTSWRQLHDDPDVFALGFSVRSANISPEVVAALDFTSWRYVSSAPTNNPTAFDLWLEIRNGRHDQVIGNWKQAE